MSLLNPVYLWGLLFTIPMVAVYLLKVKPRVEKTNAWFLWDQVLVEKQNNSLFSKLRNFLSLIMMLLAVILICLALSDPTFSKRDRRDVFILVDQSVSMNGAVDGKPAIEIAKEEAHAIVSSLGTAQRASIATVGSSVNFLTHLSSNTQELHDVIDQISVSELPDTKATGRVVASMAHSQLAKNSESNGEKEDGMRVVLISDGCLDFDFPDDLILEKVITSKEQRENVGIVAADIQPMIGSSDAMVMVQFVNSGDKEASVELEIFCEETQSIEELVKLEVSAGNNKPNFFRVKSVVPGVWKVRISHEDAMEIDNSATIILRSLPTVSVSIPEENNYFFQRCVEAFSKTSGSLVIDNELTSMKIFEGEIPDGIEADSLVFGPEGESKYWNVEGKEEEINVLAPVVLQSDHPILKHIDLNHFEFVGAKDISAPRDAKMIVETETGIPLIYQVNELDKTVVVVNLNPQLNDFFLHTGFIAIIYDAAMYLSGNQRRLDAVYPVGVDFSSDFGEQLVLSTPVGKRVDLERGETHSLKKLGLYSLEDKNKSSLAVALLSPAESLLGIHLADADTKSSTSGYPLSYWLIILAVIILILESTLYHRRKVD